jgi:hypothetical protein
MSALNFVGRLDRREEAMILNHLQEQKFINRLVRKRDPLLAKKLFGTKRVRDVYTPPTRGVNGASPVMSKN